MPKRPACPDAPPSAKAFSSCTCPRITRPRHVQRSVAAHCAGSGRKVKPGSSGCSDQRLAREAFDRDAEQDEIDVGIDGRTSPPFPLKHECAKGLRILPVAVERLDPGQVRLVLQALAERQPALGGVGDVVLPQIRDRNGERIVEPDAALLRRGAGSSWS